MDPLDEVEFDEAPAPGFSAFGGPLDGQWIVTHNNRLAYLSDFYEIEVLHIYELAAFQAGPCFSHCGSYIQGACGND